MCVRTAPAHALLLRWGANGADARRNAARRMGPVELALCVCGFTNLMMLVAVGVLSDTVREPRNAAAVAEKRYAAR